MYQTALGRHEDRTRTTKSGAVRSRARYHGAIYQYTTTNKYGIKSYNIQNEATHICIHLLCNGWNTLSYIK